MNPKSFCKSILLLFLVVAGMFYIASSFFIAKTVADAFRPSGNDGTAILSGIELVRVEAKPDDLPQREGTSVQKTPLPVTKGKREEDLWQEERTALLLNEIAELKGMVEARRNERFVTVGEDPSKTFFSLRDIVAGTIQTVLFLAFLGIPFAIARMFLLKPLKEIPLVSPDMLGAVHSDDDRKMEMAAGTIARAMVLSAERELQRLDTDAARTDELQQDMEELKQALKYPIGRATAVLNVLDRREKQAKNVARKYAQMAGLTVAISSSAMGDGIGMFFWKARLVHDTFRIYGFRPDLWTVLRIYAYVVFAAFLASSVEDLCELLDASDLVGGFGVRVLQGVVGAGVILKGGQLTRAYLTQGISEGVRKAALEQFRATAAEEFQAIGGSVAKSLASIGGFQ